MLLKGSARLRLLRPPVRVNDLNDFPEYIGVKLVDAVRPVVFQSIFVALVATRVIPIPEKV